MSAEPFKETRWTFRNPASCIDYHPVVENDAQPPAADYADNDEQGTRLREALYTLRNKRARTLLDLWSHEEGTECHGVWLNTNAAIVNQLWLIQHTGANDTYTVKSLQYSKYLEVKSGSRENRSKVVPRPRIMEYDTRLNQEWRIEELEPGEYTCVQTKPWFLASTGLNNIPLFFERLKCAYTNTFLEIAEGNPSDGAEVTCSEAAVNQEHQVWVLTRVSRTGSEIKALFESWKPGVLPRIIQPRADQIQYFVLPHEFRQQIWRDTKLLRQPVRLGVFDYNDFVIRSKDAVNSWARGQFPVQVQGFSVLFGIMYGETRRGPKAYNWYLTPDMYSLVFFEAQTGQEYSPAALDVFGFEPTFVTF